MNGAESPPIAIQLTHEVDGQNDLAVFPLRFKPIISGEPDRPGSEPEHDRFRPGRMAHSRAGSRALCPIKTGLFLDQGLSLSWRGA